MHRSVAYLLLISAAIVLVSGQWLVRSVAQNCQSIPYKVESTTINCYNTGKVYQRIECDAYNASYYECTSSDCTTGCTLAVRRELNTCDAFAHTYHCYPNSQPDYAHYVGNHYIQANYYLRDKCQGKPFQVLAYPTSCRYIGPYLSYNWLCPNGTATEEVYGDGKCEYDPSSTKWGADGACGYDSLYYYEMICT